MHAVVVVVKSPSPVQLFVTLRTAAFQASLPLPSPRVCLSSCPLMPSNHLLLLCLLLLLPWIFPSIRVFSNESAVCIKWPKYWSFSISPFKVLMHAAAAAAAAKSLQACPTLYDPRDCSPPGSPIPGILQARTLEWVAISFSNAWKWKVKMKSLSRIWLLVTPWTAAYQAPPSMGFARQEYWSGVSLPYANYPKKKKNPQKPCLRNI